jgi:branched-subunit amino acid permease
VYSESCGYIFYSVSVTRTSEVPQNHNLSTCQLLLSFSAYVFGVDEIIHTSILMLHAIYYRKINLNETLLYCNITVSKKSELRFTLYEQIVQILKRLFAVNNKHLLMAIAT